MYLYHYSWAEESVGKGIFWTMGADLLKQHAQAVWHNGWSAQYGREQYGRQWKHSLGWHGRKGELIQRASSKNLWGEAHIREGTKMCFSWC